MEVLKIKIYQPQAHYRIPFTYKRRHTYPIPPYSTVIGLLCNILGIRNYKGKGEPEAEDYKNLKNLKISIAGKFESKTTEYIWLRNLSRSAHEKRFLSPYNRYVAGHIEHIGGQSPVLIDILNEVEIYIYLYHEKKEFLEKIKRSFENPEYRLYPLHLGRAEDWIVINFLDFVKLKFNEIEGNYEHFFWIPKFGYPPDINKFFNKIRGLSYRITGFYKIENGIRNFQLLEVKLNDGFLMDIDGYIDENENKGKGMPVFLIDFTKYLRKKNG